MINVNGNIVPASQAYLSPTNRGFTYGDSVFETLRLTSGKILFWEDHYFRLMASMRILRMEIPMNFTMEFLMEQVLETAKQVFPKENSIKVRINVYRNEGGLYSPEDNTVSFVITAQKLDADFYLHNSVNYEVELFKDYYMNSGLLSTIKTNNKVLHEFI